jgi:hypothetical protein
MDSSPTQRGVKFHMVDLVTWNSDMVFWLIGVNAPIIKIHFKYISKKIEQNSWYAYEHSMSIHQSFGEKGHFLWPV